MKKLFTINSILIMSLLMITSAVSAGNTEPTSPAPNKDNILIVKGNILNDVKATITSFYYDDIDCAWHKYETVTSKNKYSMLLNPLTDYQIWYQDEAGHTKIMYIEKGESGIWQCQVHLDFEAKTELFAYMYQFAVTENFYDKYYAVEGIDLRQSEEIVANMENPCIDAILSPEE